jgi:hypothetical protein
LLALSNTHTYTPYPSFFLQTKQTMQRTVEKVIEGSKYVDQERILEYERPRPRLLQHGIVNKREAGVEFTAQVGVPRTLATPLP